MGWDSGRPLECIVMRHSWGGRLDQRMPPTDGGYVPLWDKRRWLLGSGADGAGRSRAGRGEDGEMVQVQMWWLIWLGAASWALTPPAGWSLVSSDRAERVQGVPAQGELLELPQAGGTGTATELSLLLVNSGRSVRQATVDAQGKLNLVLADGRVGRASWDAGPQRWLVLLVAPSHATALDPDAILLAAREAPPEQTSLWGETVSLASSDGSAPAALDGGRDGSPWGASDGGSASSAGWVDAGSLEAWGNDRALLGRWECSILLSGAPAQLTFSFEDDGVVRLERRVSGRTEHLSGRWSSRGDQLRLELVGAEDAETYQVVGGTLTFRYDRTRLTLYRK